MIVGDRLRILREEKKLSQGDIEKRTGLLRSYLSRVETGHTVPSIETLEKLARALDIPIYQLFYEDGEPPKLPPSLKHRGSNEVLWGDTGRSARYLVKLRRNLGALSEGDRRLMMQVAQKMARR
jgi:transcriptional regulator with XRE-family HTH domain